MLTRTLGTVTVSGLGMGCWAIGGPFTRTGGLPMGWGDVDDAESIRAIHAAIDRGVTLFDTANNYGAGHSERVLGQALAGRRDKVRIATKFGSVFDEETRQHFDVDNEIDEAFIRDALEGSLRRLGTDHIDLYQLHAGSYPVNKAAAIRETLETLVQEGKIGAYGWSTDHPDRAEVFAPGAHCVSIQFSLNLFRRNPDMLALCDRHDVAAINKHPLASGFLTGKFKADTAFPENDLRHGLDLNEGRGALRLKQIDAIRDILTAGGRTPAQGALGWLWAVSDRTIPIPGFKSVKQVEDNAGAMAHGPLTAAQVAELETILAQFEDAA